MTRWGVFLVGVVRVSLFAALLMAYVPIWLLPAPHRSTVDDFLRDVDAGRASGISIPPTSGWLDPSDDTTVTWRTGFADWHSAPFTVFYGRDHCCGDPSATFAGGTAIVEGKAYDAPSGAARDQLIGVAQEVAAAGGHRAVHIADSTAFDETLHLAPSVNTLMFWADFSIWFLLITVAWGWTPDTYATRAAWVWLFTIGIIGPFLYLWKSPSPPRFRDRSGDQPPSRPISGFGGFLRAAGCAAALTVLTLAL